MYSFDESVLTWLPFDEGAEFVCGDWYFYTAMQETHKKSPFQPNETHTFRMKS
jgi:hypothetical protein